MPGSGLCSGPVFRASELSLGPGARNRHRPGAQAWIHFTLLLSGARTVTRQSRKKQI